MGQVETKEIESRNGKQRAETESRKLKTETEKSHQTHDFTHHVH